MTYKHYLLSIALLLLAFGAGAQTATSFPTEQEPFVKALQEYMRAIKRDEVKATDDKFNDNVKAGKFSPDQMTAIITTSNLMLAQKMRAYPHFNDYLTALNNFAESGAPADLFTKWESILDKVITGSRRGSSKEFSAYMDFSQGLFTQNAIYTSKSKNWIASSKDFDFSMDGDRPKLAFKSVDLLGATEGDSIWIRKTQGAYYPIEQKWEGKGGTVDWSSAGFKADEVYAELGTYTLDLTKADIKIDSVQFYNKALFSTALMGYYADKLSPHTAATGFPLFVSYRTDLKIDDLGPNVKYEGGFALAGSQIRGGGDSTSKVSVSFYNDAGKKVLQAWAKDLLIKKKQSLAATDAQISLYMGTDSIFHPGVTLKYNMDKKELSMFTGSEGIAATPFFDSFHKKEIRAEQITWNLNSPELNIKMVGSAGKDPVTLTSENYFQKGELEKWQGAMDYNPISVIKMYSESSQSRVLDAGMLAKRMNPNYSEGTISRLLLKMMEQGFIVYDPATSTVTVKDKVFNYVAANADKSDYDIIKISSFSTQTNGKMNLETNDIVLQGVPMITLSDSQEVRIFPGKGDSIQIQKSQDMTFSNIVIAGIVDFIGKGFHFSYDSFKINLTDLASATINVPTGEKDKDGDAIFKPLKSKIEGLTGILQIDKPDNKSGRKPSPGYPIFTNTQKSYVYYDKKEIVDSAYTRDHFFFELDPFQLDSMKTFDPYKSDLAGRLVSADIFPTFDETLKIQPDLSLGFKRVTPEKGYDIYKAKGHYNDSIRLSNDGLRGKGQIKYLFTYFKSDSILFAPDSLNAVSDTFHMTKSTYSGSTYPLVVGKDNDIHWIPYGDSMYINMRTVPFLMYEEGSSLKGNLLLTAKGLKGNGAFEFKEASLASNDFNFQSESLNADTMSMQIKSIDNKSATFKTPNVSGNVDFAKRIGEFKANEKDIPTDFANNYYKTEINEFKWYMDDNILDFRAPAGSEGVYFTSTKPGQDSLKFLGKRGVFNMTTSIIVVTGVPEVRVADASIVPDSGKLTILPGGLLDSLTNATVIADTANKAHKLYNASLTILNRKDYTGSGLYDYTYGTTKETIKFNNISVKHEGEKRKATNSTIANTTIDETDTFKLNNGIRFKGAVALEASKDKLNFDGFGKLILTGGQPDSSDWFGFKDDIDPNDVAIHYATTLNPDKDTLFTGIGYAALDSISFYPSLMRKMKNPDDKKAFVANGIAKFDDAKKTFTFGDEDKIKKGTAFGNTLTYDMMKKQIVAEGSFDMGVDFKPIELVTSGNIVEDLDSNKFIFNTFIGMKLPVDKNLMTQFATDVNAFTFDLPAADYTTRQFEVALANTMSAKKAASVLEDVKKNGQFAKPKDLSDMNLIISNAKMLYDAEYQIFRSLGPVSVSFIGETGIHKQLVGYVEFGLRKGNDFFNIYFESKTDGWYYLSYYNKTLQMISSKEDFNKMLAAIPADKRKIKMGANGFFFYTIGTFQNQQGFLQQMHQIESGIKVDMEMPSEDDQMQDQLDSLKLELLKEANQDSLQDNNEAPVPDAGGKKGKKGKAPKAEDNGMNPDYQQPSDNAPAEPAATPTNQQPAIPKEILDYENKNKKKKKKGKDDDMMFDEQTPSAPNPSNKKPAEQPPTDTPQQESAPSTPTTPEPAPTPTPAPDTEQKAPVSPPNGGDGGTTTSGEQQTTVIEAGPKGEPEPPKDKKKKKKGGSEEPQTTVIEAAPADGGSTPSTTEPAPATTPTPPTGGPEGKQTRTEDTNTGGSTDAQPSGSETPATEPATPSAVTPADNTDAPKADEDSGGKGKKKKKKKEDDQNP